MPTSPIEVLFRGYQLLNSKEKQEFFRLIKEEQGNERTNKLYSGIQVENMTVEEEQLFNMVKDLRENAVYLDP